MSVMHCITTFSSGEYSRMFVVGVAAAAAVS